MPSQTFPCRSCPSPAANCPTPPFLRILTAPYPPRLTFTCLLCLDTTNHTRPVRASSRQSCNVGPCPLLYLPHSSTPAFPLNGPTILACTASLLPSVTSPGEPFRFRPPHSLPRNYPPSMPVHDLTCPFLPRLYVYYLCFLVMFFSVVRMAVNTRDSSFSPLYFSRK